MTHDLGDRSDPATAVRGFGWLRRSVPRPAAPVPPVDEPTVDLTVLAYDRMLTNTEEALERAENQLLGAQAKTEAILQRLADRRRWCGATAEAVLSELKHEVFEVHLIVTGRTK